MSGNEDGARTAPKAWTSHAARMLGMSESVVLALIVRLAWPRSKPLAAGRGRPSE